jgi:hypothetical protein
MSTGLAVKARNSDTSPSTERSDNPFDTIFDGDDDNSDEWWDEETVDSSTHKDKIPLYVSERSKPSEPVGLGVSVKPASRMTTRRHTRTYSVQKPVREKSKGRQKKQNAKAGIKVVTDFSRHQPTGAPVQLQPSQTLPHMGRFVDMAALRALNGESNQSSGSFWRTKKDKALTRAPNTAPTLTKDLTTQATTSNPTRLLANRTSQTFLQSPFRANDDLSPNDRPIVIGISIPSSDISVHSVSPQTAVSETTNPVHNYQRRPHVNHTPDTPTIIITPAQETSAWSPLDTQSMSSDYEVYKSSSQSSRHYTANDAPPVPQMPNSYLENERQRVAAQKSYFSPDSDDVTTWGDDEDTHASPRSRRISTYTVFEEDDSPVMTRTGRAVSISRADKHASISTVATRRRSKGWWNYITTPFLTRSNTFATRELEHDQAPAVPDLAIAVAKAQVAERDGVKWEKQFSPLTPKTSTTVVSDQWWDIDAKKSEQSPVVRDTRHKVQTSTGTLPIVLSETAGFGAASTSSLVSLDTDQLSRENTSSSFGHTGESDSVEREVPILAEAPRTRSMRSNNPYVQPSLSALSEVSRPSQPLSREAAELPHSAPAPASALTPGQTFYSPSVGGPPPYSASNRVKYKAILPPSHNADVQYPVSPGPISPGLQQAMSSGGAIPMSEVPLSPQARRPINLNSGYPVLVARQIEVPVSGEHYGVPPTKASKKAEKKRRRHEKEEAIAHRAGGFWRGRGCVPSRGCYGRKGAEGRKRRRWYLCLIIFFLCLIILIIALATTLHRKSNTVTQPSQWLNLTGFPPIFLGLSTVMAPVNVEANTGCVFPATKWSCDLPKELQPSTAPNQPDQPNFFLYLQWDNSSAANATFANVTGNKNLITRAAGSPVSAGQFMKHLLLKAREIVTFTPNPAPPTFAEEFFLGNTTDGIVSSNKAGEPTPFYISFLSSLNASTSSVKKRHPLSSAEDQLISGHEEVLDERDSNPFPNISQIIPSPALNSDGTAAPANLLPSPLPLQQPIRLYDRGLPTEHYGFYSYFDRSIYLKSLTNLNETNLQNGEVPDDLNGGATEAEANFRCTWTETRFLVQMWTRMGSTSRLNNVTSSSSSSAAELLQPGSFPYPVTVTIDRHGGVPATKMLYCYSMNDREGIVAGTGQVIGENRAFGGTPINPAPTVFFNSSTTTAGGFDGGTGGCACAWTNFQNVIAAGT